MSKRTHSGKLSLFGSKKPKNGESSLEGRVTESADPRTTTVTNPAEQQITDLYSTEGDTGIRVIANPADPRLDIVFVHGLTGNRDKTWTHSNGVFWPNELAVDIPTARIMTFGYDADVVKLWGVVGSNTLRNHGKNLASDTSDQRRACRERPIIFIAHSLGGLVCEQALLVCREGNTNLEKLFQSTKGIIFMGTPHRGAELADWGYTLAKYLNVIRHTSPAILGALQHKSEVLAAVQQQFQQTLLKPSVVIQIYCFFEEKPVVGVGIIVSEDSAVLPQYPNQSIGANHMDMTKYSGRQDVGYQRVLNRVIDIVELLISTPVVETSQREHFPPEAGYLKPASETLEQEVPPYQAISNAGPGTAIMIGNQSVQGGFNIHCSNNLDHQNSNKCQQLLRTSDYERHKERNPLPVKGTCQWFLNHTNYCNWRDSATSSLLWVSANPGCGKSVLSKFLIESEINASGGNRTICYFFFKDDNEDQRLTTNALCALLHQLFNQKPELLNHALEVYNQNGDRLITNIDLLWNLLIRVSADSRAGDIICILDALDECEQSELNYLLPKVCNFYKKVTPSDKTTLKFLLTSRPLQRIVDLFNTIYQDLPTIRLAGEEKTDQIKREIDLVIEDELEQIKQKWQLDEKTLAPLREELSNVEHRTYLWLKLIFDLIRKDAQFVTKSGRLKIFGKIPDSVDAAYTAILNQSTDKEQAKKILQIVCAAIRPLSIKEMSIAIAIRPDHETVEDLDLEFSTEEHCTILIRNLCGLFVSIIDGKVYLLHQTAKEFLIGEIELPQSTTATDWIWKHSFSVQTSNLVLAHICMWHTILVEIYWKDKFPDAGEYFQHKRRRKFPFASYAAKEWPVHFRKATIPAKHSSIALALKLYRLLSDVRADDFGLDGKENNLFLASLFGHTGVVAELLAVPGIDVNERYVSLSRPLHTAIMRCSTDIVRQLLAAPGIDVNVANEFGWMPLHVAAMKDSTAIVSQLLAAPGIDVNVADYFGWTPLHVAVQEDRTTIVGQLLATPGIDFNVRDDRGVTPLSIAIDTKNAVIKGLLLSHRESRLK